MDKFDKILADARNEAEATRARKGRVSGFVALFVATFVAGALSWGMLPQDTAPTVDVVSVFCDGAWKYASLGRGTPEQTASFMADCIADMRDGVADVNPNVTIANYTPPGGGPPPVDQ